MDYGLAIHVLLNARRRNEVSAEIAASLKPAFVRGMNLILRVVRVERRGRI